MAHGFAPVSCGISRVRVPSFPLTFIVLSIQFTLCLRVLPIAYPHRSIRPIETSRIRKKDPFNKYISIHQTKPDRGCIVSKYRLRRFGFPSKRQEREGASAEGFRLLPDVTRVLLPVWSCPLTSDIRPGLVCRVKGFSDRKGGRGRESCWTVDLRFRRTFIINHTSHKNGRYDPYASPSNKVVSADWLIHSEFVVLNPSCGVNIPPRPAIAWHEGFWEDANYRKYMVMGSLDNLRVTC